MVPKIRLLAQTVPEKSACKMEQVGSDLSPDLCSQFRCHGWLCAFEATWVPNMLEFVCKKLTERTGNLMRSDSGSPRAVQALTFGAVGLLSLLMVAALTMMVFTCIRKIRSRSKKTESETQKMPQKQGKKAALGSPGATRLHGKRPASTRQYEPEAETTYRTTTTYNAPTGRLAGPADRYQSYANAESIYEPRPFAKLAASARKTTFPASRRTIDDERDYSSRSRTSVSSDVISISSRGSAKSKASSRSSQVSWSREDPNQRVAPLRAPKIVLVPRRAPLEEDEDLDASIDSDSRFDVDDYGGVGHGSFYEDGASMSGSSEFRGQDGDEESEATFEEDDSSHDSTVSHPMGEEPNSTSSSIVGGAKEAEVGACSAAESMDHLQPSQMSTTRATVTWLSTAPVVLD